MFSKSIYVVFVVLAFVTMACGININLPAIDVKTGPTVTDDIYVQLLDDPDAVAKVTLGFGAGELYLASGAANALVTGTATYNIADLKPDVTIYRDEVRIETGDLEINGIPNFPGKNYINEWDLKLGAAPMELTINAGAYKGDIDLGGLALRSLNVLDGAADVDLTFSEPNKSEMDVLRYTTGASDVELTGLANANFKTMRFKGGAGNFTLDFSGQLTRDANVTIDVGVSSVTIIVPKGVSARVFVDEGLSNVDLSGDWEKSGGDYYQSGEGPRLTINVNIALGSLRLSNR